MLVRNKDKKNSRARPSRGRREFSCLAKSWAARILASRQVGQTQEDFHPEYGDDVPPQNEWAPVRVSLHSGTEHARLLFTLNSLVKTQENWRVWPGWPDAASSPLTTWPDAASSPPESWLDTRSLAAHDLAGRENYFGFYPSPRRLDNFKAKL